MRKITKEEFRQFLFDVYDNKEVTDDTKKKVYKIFENYKFENIQMKSYIEILQAFIEEKELYNETTELASSLIYRGTLIRIINSSDFKFKYKQLVSWTYDAMYLSEINVSDHGTVIITSTEISNSYGIRIDDFCKYLYDHKYIHDQISCYEAEVIYPLKYEILVSDITYNGLDD